MKKFCTITILLFSFLVSSFAQSVQWEKDNPGKLLKPAASKIPQFNIEGLFRSINSLPFMSAPKGFDIKEAYFINTSGRIYSANGIIGFYPHSRTNKGIIEPSSSHPIAIAVFINDPVILMDKEKYLFPEESDQLKTVRMFTDTFSIKYNNEGWGQGYSTMFNANKKLYVFNPGKRSFFRPVKREEYLKFWIGKLGLEIEKAAKNVEENNEALKFAKSNAAMATSLPELEKISKAVVKWLDFLKTRKTFYERQLNGLSAKERSSAAFYTFPKREATLPITGGEVEGGMSYEPADEHEELVKIPLFTFSNEPFDTKVAKTAIQLIVFQHYFSDNELDEKKKVLDDNFFERLPYNELLKMMNR